MLLVLLVIWLTKYVGRHDAAEQAADVELGAPDPALPIPPTSDLSFTDIRALPSAEYPLSPGGLSVCPICLEDFFTGTKISILLCRHRGCAVTVFDMSILRPDSCYLGLGMETAIIYYFLYSFHFDFQFSA
jgi:hypothetical protein